ncbi:uncharacterized protein LOC128964386 [Oppia nitens]|uniref:uncharacterized protein LOC128964386 n=1 Tax=Oppia nitens TaxID=1686743 RepID=UPI0023D986A1|nr:uncharacterized protein LOC128964386 [Oppia nitens]
MCLKLKANICLSMIVCLLFGVTLINILLTYGVHWDHIRMTSAVLILLQTTLLLITILYLSCCLLCRLSNKIRSSMSTTRANSLANIETMIVECNTYGTDTIIGGQLFNEKQQDDFSKNSVEYHTIVYIK